jgi:1-deoxy-D-xylulose-5-phosphate synthase
MKPVVAIYSTFLQRGYDEIVHDVCLQNLPVVFAIDRAGIVGEDGPTHNGTYDISYLRHIPNLVVMAPKNESELRHMMATALSHDGPIAFRYPRGSTFQALDDGEPCAIPIGKAEVLRDGNDILIVAVGNAVQPAFEASRLIEEIGISSCVINARFVKPLDMGLIGNLSAKIKLVLTVEENVLEGGFGSAVLEHLSELHINGLRVERIGLPDRFIEHGTQKLLRKITGLDAEGIARRALALTGRKTGDLRPTS